MKKYLIVLLCTQFISANLFDITSEIRQLIAAEDNCAINRSSDRSFIIIGLGTNCQVAWYARKLGLRDFAYPFDWCITPFQAVYDLIENNFKSFFLKENLVQDTDHSVKDSLYNIRFLHDFPAQQGGATSDNNTHYWGALLPNYLDSYESIVQKYRRRIERFYWAINSGKKIYFVRIFDITKQESIELSELIQSKFPELDYELVVISQYEEFKEPWNIAHIKPFYVSKNSTHDFWPGDITVWEKIYSEFGFFDKE